jgi:hypothetical protein
VKSSAIRRVEHHEHTLRLTIWFVEGHSCAFREVPRHVYNSLITARSIDVFYAKHIFDRYRC